MLTTLRSLIHSNNVITMDYEIPKTDLPHFCLCLSLRKMRRLWESFVKTGANPNLPFEIMCSPMSGPQMTVTWHLNAYFLCLFGTAFSRVYVWIWHSLASWFGVFGMRWSNLQALLSKLPPLRSYKTSASARIGTVHESGPVFWQTRSIEFYHFI